MTQACFFQVLQPLAGKADAGGDQVGVIPQIVGFRHQLFQVLAQGGFATGETDLHSAHLAGVMDHGFPFGGGEFVLVVIKIGWVAAERALERAFVGQLQKQPYRVALTIKIEVGSSLCHGTPPETGERGVR